MALSSALISIISSNLPAFIAAVLVAPFLLTWLNCRFGDRKGKPPLVPHFIPYVGHGLSMPVVSPGYIAKLRYGIHPQTKTTASIYHVYIYISR